MEGFYTREQAASVLGVSSRQVSNYMKDGHIGIIYSGRRAWLPKEDVQRLYDRARHGLAPGSGDLEEIKATVAKLVHEVEVLKLGLGFGAKSRLRSEPELLLLRQKFMDLLGETSWSRKQMSGIADDLISLQETEIINLVERNGATAWLPLQELVNNMLGYVESDPEFPAAGLDILQSRLQRAKERFISLIYVTAKVPSRRQGHAGALHEAMSPPGGMDQAILGYIMAQK